MPTPKSRSCRSFSTTRPPIRCSRRWSPSAAPGSRRAKASTTGTAATSRRCTGKPRPSSPSCWNSCGAESARRRRERGRKRSRGSVSGGRALLPAHGDVAGLAPHAPEPCLDGGKARKLEASFVGHVRVGIEPDVGDRVPLAHEEAAARQMLLHDPERGVPGRHLLLEPGLVFLRAAEVTNDVARHRDVGLVAVLLEEEPLQDLRPKQALGGQEGRSLRQIVEDGIGLREIDPSFDLEDRDLAVRVLGEKGRRPRLLVENVDVHPLVRPLELGEQQLDLVAVPRLQIPVDPQHATPPGLTPSTRSAMNTLSSYSPSNFRARRLMPSVTKPDAR